MRKLFLMRGLPGSGKSTWLKSEGFDPYAVSSDQIRLMLRSPEMNSNGTFSISQADNGPVWTMLFQILEKRMSQGCLTFVDATHIKAKDMNQYKTLADKYRYEVFVVDFTDIETSEVYARNEKRRGHHSYVPSSVIEKMNQNLESETLPSWAKKVKPSEVRTLLVYKTIDLSQYKRVHHIGDLQSCYEVLNEYLKGEDLNDDEFYIFVGDFLDRGTEHAEVLHFILKIAGRSNVAMVEGNHEIHLWNWANNQPAKSPEFNDYTMPGLNAGGFDKKSVRQALRNLKEVFIYRHGNTNVVVTHAGIGALPDLETLGKVPSQTFIKGVGTYNDDMDDAFNVHSEGFYQVHGHRNTQGYPVVIGRSINLEGKVEFGGCLRVAVLENDNFLAVEVKNNRIRALEADVEDASLDFVDRMRKNSLINERDNGNGISSFNFSRKAFYDKVWNAQTIQARGLFVHVESREIVARSYNKFFNVGEFENTKLEALRERFKFPVKTYVKENGFLGIVGYDKRRDELVIASKSTIHSDFAGWFKDILMKSANMESIKRVTRGGLSLVFEVIDPKNDPHIIKYAEPKAVLLDVIHNEVEFRKLPDKDAQGIALSIGVEFKRTYSVIENWEDFEAWYTIVTAPGFQLPNQEETEGFVIEDSSGYMVKVKLDYYAFWKQMRGVRDRVAKKSLLDESRLCENGRAFCAWLKRQEQAVIELDVITLREMYLKAIGVVD